MRVKMRFSFLFDFMDPRECPLAMGGRLQGLFMGHPDVLVISS